MKVQTQLREFLKWRGLYTLLTSGATKLLKFLNFHLESYLGHTNEIPFNPQYILFCILMGVQEPLIKFATEHFFVKSLKVQTRLREFLKSIPFYTRFAQRSPHSGPNRGVRRTLGLWILLLYCVMPNYCKIKIIK